MHDGVPTDRLVEASVIAACGALYNATSLPLAWRDWNRRHCRADAIPAIIALAFFVSNATCSALLGVARNRSSPDNPPYIAWRYSIAFCLGGSEYFLLFKLTVTTGHLRRKLLGASVVLQLVWVGLGLVLWRLAETSPEAVWAFPGMTHLCLTVLVCKPLHLWRRLNVKAQMIFFHRDMGKPESVRSTHWYLAAAMVATTSASLTMGVCSFNEPPEYHFSIQLAIVLVIIMVPWRKEVQTMLRQGDGEPAGVTGIEAGKSHDGVSQEQLLSNRSPKLSIHTPLKAILKN